MHRRPHADRHRIRVGDAETYCPGPPTRGLNASVIDHAAIQIALYGSGNQAAYPMTEDREKNIYCGEADTNNE
jgi:hypothetical protein